MIFSIEKQEEPYYEEDIIITHCHQYQKNTYDYYEHPPKNTIPIGSVDWCEKVYGQITPDNYPKFMEEYFNREIYLEEFNPNKLYENLFVKPAEKYKKFNGTTNFDATITHCKKGDLIWCSENLFINIQSPEDWKRERGIK